MKFKIAQKYHLQSYISQGFLFSGSSWLLVLDGLFTAHFSVTSYALIVSSLSTFIVSSLSDI